MSISIYRIENPQTMHGMWYDGEGNYNPFIFNLTEGISRDLPMDPHARYGSDGMRWYSAGKTRENMNEWFSPTDAVELQQAGYVLYEFTVSQYRMEEHQVLFTRQGIELQKEIPLSAVWDLT